MEQSSATTSQPSSPEPTGAGHGTDAADATRPGFAARGRLRRRARFLRKARELAYRDLGGLVFNLHRFGQRNDELVLAKFGTLGQIDSELRSLESFLEERQPVTVLREAGITACPRCAAIHGSEDRFCPNCGLPLSRNVDLPVAGPPSASASPGAAAAGQSGGPPRTWAPPAPGPPAPARGSLLGAPTPPVRAATTKSPPLPPPGASSPGAAREDAPPTGRPAASAPPVGTPGPTPPVERGPDSPAAPGPDSPGAPGPDAPAPSPGAAPAAGSTPGPAPPAPVDRADEEEPTEVVRPRSGGT